MTNHRGTTIGNEFLLKMIGIPCRERESENRCANSIQALTWNRLSQNGLHYCIASHRHVIKTPLNPNQPMLLLCSYIISQNILL